MSRSALSTSQESKAGRLTFTFFVCKEAVLYNFSAGSEEMSTLFRNLNI